MNMRDMSSGNIKPDRLQSRKTEGSCRKFSVSSRENLTRQV